MIPNESANVSSTEKFSSGTNIEQLLFPKNCAMYPGGMEGYWLVASGVGKVRHIHMIMMKGLRGNYV